MRSHFKVMFSQCIFISILMCICNHISISICFRVQQVQEHDPSSQFSGRSRCRVLVTAASDVTCSIFLTTSPLCSQPWENLKWHHDHLSKRNGQISNRVTSTFFYLPYSECHIEPLTAPLPCVVQENANWSCEYLTR